MQASLNYDGTNLTETLQDALTGATFTHIYTNVNIPALVGGDSAYVGFTAGTGSLTAVQNIQAWTVVSGPFLAVPTNVQAVAANGPQVQLTWNDNSTSVTSFVIDRATDSGFTQNLTSFSVPATSTGKLSYTDATVLANVTYWYRVRAVSGSSDSPESSAVSVLVPIASTLNFSGGFAGATGLRLNGSATIAGANLQLTDGGMREAGSVFSTSMVNVAAFSTAFTFQLSSAVADGFTFTIQGSSPTALGSSGGGLGFGPDNTTGPPGIADSVAVKFDLFSNQGEGPDSTGLFTDGAAPTDVGSINLSGSGINLHSGDIFSVAMTYDGTTLQTTITDTATNASASQAYAVNIPAVVGGSLAYVGFTGGTGVLSAVQDIQSWTFTSTAATPDPSTTYSAGKVTVAAFNTQFTLPSAVGGSSDIVFLIQETGRTTWGRAASTAGPPRALRFCSIFPEARVEA